MAGAAVIINEFGEVGLDHLLVTTPAENMILLRSGCLCCTVRGDLIETLADLWKKRENKTIPSFDRVLVETTGLADPVPVLRTLATEEEISELFRSDTVLSVVDGVNGDAQLDAHEESVKQAVIADVLLVSKGDLAEAAVLEKLKVRLARLNPGAQMLQAVCGNIDCSVLFSGALWNPATKSEQVEQWLRAEAYAESVAHEHGHQHHHHDVNRHDDRIRAFSLRHEAPISGSGLTAWLNMLAGLRGANLLRVKGLVNVEGKAVAVHAVQSVLHEPLVLDCWPSDDRSSRIVFITRDMERTEVEKTLALFALNPARPADATGFDLQAYQRFVQMAGVFQPKN
jgi:G3E family GTPase